MSQEANPPPPSSEPEPVQSKQQPKDEVVQQKKEEIAEEQIAKEEGPPPEEVQKEEPKQQVGPEPQQQEQSIEPITQEVKKEEEAKEGGSIQEISPRQPKEGEKEQKTPQKEPENLQNQQQNGKSEEKPEEKKEESVEEKSQQNAQKTEQKAEQKESKVSESGQKVMSQQKIEKDVDSVKQISELKQGEKKDETADQIIQNYFKQYEPSGSKQVKQSIVSLANQVVTSKLIISPLKIHKFLNSDSEHSLDNFKSWLEGEESKEINSFVQQFLNSPAHKQLSSHLKKIETALSLADSSGSSLKINLGVGEPRSKSSLKWGMTLGQPSSPAFSIAIDVRIKKKSELKQFLQAEIRKGYKSQELHLSKMCKFQFTQTEKTLRMEITSPAIEEQILNNTIILINEIASNEHRPVIKLEGEVGVKSSLRVDQARLQSKKLVKWVAEGTTSSLKIDGNPKVIRHFTSPIAQIFPVLSVMKGGEVNLKLKSAENVDKLFDKLGISEIAEQTPSLRQFIEQLSKEYLDPVALPWVGDLLKRSMIFACSIPNERVSWEVQVKMSALEMWASVSGEACKELGEAISKATLQEFK